VCLRGLDRCVGCASPGRTHARQVWEADRRDALQTLRGVESVAAVSHSACALYLPCAPSVQIHPCCQFGLELPRP
jgi:hypothetical protein